MDDDSGRVGHDHLQVQFSGELFQWRGPSPYHFVRVPDEVADELAEEAERVSYGWGMIPGMLTIGRTTWYTALWPREGGYVVPIKNMVRRAESLDLGDLVAITMVVGSRE